MFNPIRVIKSLEEDFKILGLNPEQQLQEMRTVRTPDQLNGILPLEEDTEEGDAGSLTEGKEDLSEALKRVKMKRMKASDRAEARRSYRKKRSKVKRKLKILRKKPAYKRKKAKLKRMKGGRKAGARKKFVMASNQMLGNLTESVATVKETGLVEAFTNMRRFADHFIHLCERDESEKLVHVGEPLKDSGKTLQPDNEKHQYVGEPTSDEPLEGDDLEKAGVADKESHKHVGDDEDALGEEFLRIAYGKNLPESFSNISEDANEALTRLKNHTISPADAAKVLQDMAKYIEGALEAFKGIVPTPAQKDLKHVGEKPNEEGTKPVKASEHGAYVGEGEPKPHTEKPVDPSKDNKYIGQEPNTEKTKPVAPEKDLQHVGGSPKARTEKPVAPEKVTHVGENPYEKPSKEEPVLK